MQVKIRQLPDRRLLQSQPDHRLDQHAHAGHAGNRSRHGLHVIGPVLALGAVAESDDAAENSGQHLPADKEAEGEIHVRRRNAAQRPENEDRHRPQQQMVFGSVDGRQERPGLDLALRRIGFGPHRCFQNVRDWPGSTPRCRTSAVIWLYLSFSVEANLSTAYLRAMNIFVTGGAGYIGSVCVEELLNAGHDVTVYDNLSEGHRSAVDDRAVFIQADLSDLESSLAAVMRDAKPGAVLHFAGQRASSSKRRSAAPPPVWRRASPLRWTPDRSNRPE